MKGTVVWFTGLPASGKTTLARAVRCALDHRCLRGIDARVVIDACIRAAQGSLA